MESHLHRMAKELLYKEIMENKQFEWKDKTNKIHTWKFNDKINSKDITHDYFYKIVMELPYFNNIHTYNVSTPYSFGGHNIGYCGGEEEPYELCKIYDFDYFNDISCPYNQINYDGYCKCLNCSHFIKKKGMYIFDIMVLRQYRDGFYKMDLVIEIVNKHYPKWKDEDMPGLHDVLIIKAEDILKRVSNTPVYVMWDKYQTHE